MSAFLQYGYLGFLAIMIGLSYKIIVNTSSRTFAQTIVLLAFFTMISTGVGVVGYLWASKELDAANARKSSLALMIEQVKSMQDAHAQEMLPLQKALDEASDKMMRSVLTSTRKEYREEVVEINEIITARNNAFSSQLSAVQALAQDKAQ